MRLIDAHDIEYEHICGEFRVSEEKINAMPTVCDIDAIRAEIEQAENRGVLNMNYVLSIIDRHTKGANECTHTQ